MHIASKPYKSYATTIAHKMPSHKKHRFSCKIWIEHEGKPLLGKGGAKILEEIDSTESLSKASKNLSMSYRYVWNYVQKIEKAIGEQVIETYRGGKLGGGGARLTDLGRGILEEYERVEGYLEKVLEDEEYWEMISLKISARNRLRGKVVSVQKDGVTAQVKVDVTVPVTVTALISKEAVDDLNIKVGDTVEAIVKATEVMIGK
jgi:molybdate transport system regulatory protein